ncbi:MAG: hypothetical protein QOJ50_75 [Cryptosporangiaceae bacterium]|nr:hypothetical protein [Cryptosporangiaceae bacterium]
MRTLTVIRRIAQVAALAATAAAISATAAPSPASAAPAHAIRYRTPTVPVVVDGVRYPASGIHRFDGRQLFFVIDTGKASQLVAYTKHSDFAAAVAAKEARIHAQLHPRLAGQYAIYYTNDDWSGDSLQVNSGSAISDLRGALRCNIFHCWGDFNDDISSLQVNGSQILYTEPNFGGGQIWVGGAGGINLSPYGLDNVASSVNVLWT